MKSITLIVRDMPFGVPPESIGVTVYFWKREK